MTVNPPMAISAWPACSAGSRRSRTVGMITIFGATTPGLLRAASIFSNSRSAS